MNIVIYDDESLEPITVVNLPLTDRDTLEFAREGRRWRLAVQEQFSFSPNDDDAAMGLFEPKIVDLWFEKLWRRGIVTTMCFTRAADLAMLLNPSWLHGQRGAVQELQNKNDKLVELLNNIFYHGANGASNTTP